MDVCGDQPKPEEWQDFPAMYGGAADAEEARILTPTPPLDPEGQKARNDDMTERLASVTRDGALYLSQQQILVLVKAEAENLAQKLRDVMPTHRFEVLEQLAEIRRLTLLLTDGLLP